MMLNIQTNAAILNIFKNDSKHIAEFIRHHAPLVRQLFLLDTGSTDGSLELARSVAQEFTNVTVASAPFREAHFAKFRNRCLSDFEHVRLPEITHCFWVDTDERLFHVRQQALPLADVYVIERTDVSGRFSTWLQRGFSVAAMAAGRWQGRVHEGFHISSLPGELRISELNLLHLESEMNRPQEKKLLYFDLINRELAEYVRAKDLVRARQFASLAIMMASFDFEEPALCVHLYAQHHHLFDSIPGITELNALIHVIRSLSRLGIDATILGQQVIETHPAKSTVYQVLRGLLFNYSNTRWIKSFYEKEYRTLPDNIVPEFYNADFSLPEQVTLFERRIARQLHWLDADYLKLPTR